MYIVCTRSLFSAVICKELFCKVVTLWCAYSKIKDYVSGVDTWCLWLYALDYSKFHLLIILYLRILSRMLLIKHICLKFNSVVTINVESLDYILCFLNTNSQWSKLLLKKKKRKNHLQRNGEAQAGFQFDQLLRGQSCEMSQIWRIHPCKKIGRLG